MTRDMLTKAGLDPKALAQPHLMLDDSRPGFRPGSHDVCLMRGGVVFADRVTTVSPTYAREVYQAQFGFGMQVGGMRSVWMAVFLSRVPCILVSYCRCLLGWSE